MSAVLGRRVLGRTTLARQLLLGRQSRPVADALEHLVGLQGQVPKVPHLALWDRLTGYDPAELDRLMTARAVVRTPLMRTTIHTVTTRDALALRPLFQPVLDRVFAGTAWGQRLRGQDVSEVVETARTLFAERPMTRATLIGQLADRYPGVDAEAVAFGVGYWVPWVQPPPRGLWGESAAPVLTPLADWAGAVPVQPMRLNRVVTRYLAAFGPSSVRDVQAWCGLTRLREVTDEIDLRRYRSQDGGELLDLPDAPLVDPDTPAPIRFLAEYDNVTLSHADRSRVIGDDSLQPLHGGPGGWVGTVVVDGLVSATWAARPTREGTSLEVRTARSLTQSGREDVEAEGRRLLAFLAPGGEHLIRVTGP